MENEVKEPAPKYNYISPEEYLALERASQEKHEYYDGYVQAMGLGASKEHNWIEANIIGELHAHLKRKDCRVMTGNMKVSTPSHDTYMYPDALIVCGEPEWQDDKSDTLLNPSVIFEILSPSTQRYDKTHKFLHYQQIPSLKEFVLIESKKRHVYIARTQQDGAWRFEDTNEATTQLFIKTINLNISLDDLYHNTGL
jgi:Uma2 family endonuclease